jgi:hypothetical protein
MRYLQYHFGPTGYGIVPKAQSLPLVTGSYLHEGQAALCRILRDADRLPTVPEVRAVVRQVGDRYRQVCSDTGYLSILGNETTAAVIAEQQALLSGMLWALYLKVLPWLYQTYRVRLVEEPAVIMLSCTCGAGIHAPHTEHIEKGCTGIALQQRLDVLAEHRTGSGLAYFETKTTSWDSGAWAEQWEITPQLGLGTLRAAERFGKEVTELYIITVSKGSRKMDDRFGRKIQQTPLCYGYCRPANPPLLPEDWLPAYKWHDAGGTRYASKAHQRQPIALLESSDWPGITALRHANPHAPVSELWVRQLPDSILSSVCFVLGPLNRQDVQLASLERGLLADEQVWQQTLWTLYGDQAASWSSEEYQEALDSFVPCSWACRPFGKEHECPYVPICYRQAGWNDPLATDRYVPRRPHHPFEHQQAQARGLLPSVGSTVDEE